jgi:hypothetical protein
MGRWHECRGIEPGTAQKRLMHDDDDAMHTYQYTNGAFQTVYQKLFSIF